jgi:imidazoleglycerol-phosphate dehydratase/histidinol-phosphatase
MKKVLFIDRDGTLIIEPPDEQVDSLEKLEFYPGVIGNLSKIVSQLDYDLVMVTNQDGLGTAAFPEEAFWLVHQRLLKTLEGEGIKFKEILIDRSLPQENAPTRKPRTGLLTKYLKGDYNLENSYVIGDRRSDVELAKNLGAKAILISNQPSRDAVLVTTSWSEIFKFLRFPHRKTSIIRNTSETSISIQLDLDGTGISHINTGLGFFDHMLNQIARHSVCDLSIEVKGDLKVDEHHTIEDTALALGEAFYNALGDKQGIERYGFLLPMDDSLAQVAIDFSGRSWLVWEVEFKRERVGDMPTEMFYHFFKSFCDAARCNLNIQARGENEHHKIEAIFKAVAKSIKMAIKRDIENTAIPSTKGIL